MNSNYEDYYYETLEDEYILYVLKTVLHGYTEDELLILINHPMVSRIVFSCDDLQYIELILSDYDFTEYIRRINNLRARLKEKSEDLPF